MLMVYDVLRSVLVIGFPLGRSAWGLVVGWSSCPQIQMGEVTDYDCDMDRGAWLLSPLANVPGGANSLNIFHNPYPPLGCIELAFYCRKDSVILGDLYYQPRALRSPVCPGFNIMLAKGSMMLQLRTNPAARECQTAERWMSMDLFVFRQNDYVFMYGCHQAADGLSVSVGAWILVDANATVGKRNRVLQMARKLALKIPGFRDEWWAFPRKNERCVGNWSCEYLAQCITSEQDEHTSVPEADTTQTMYIILCPVLFVLVMLAFHLVYKYVQGNKIGPMQATEQRE